MIVVNISFVMVWHVATSTSSESLREISTQNLAKSSSNLASAIRRVIEDTRSDAISAAALDLPSEAIETGDGKNVVYFADQLIRTKGRYKAIIVTDAKGKIVASDSVGAAPSLPSIEAPWVQDVMKSAPGSPTWLSPARPGFLLSRLQGSERLFGFALPVIDVMGDAVGTMSIFVSTAQVAQLLDGFASSGAQRDAFSLLVDRSGVPLAMPTELTESSSWAGFQVPADLDSVRSPEGLDYHGGEEVITGSVHSEGWRAVVFQTTQLFERPVDAMSQKLLLVALFAISVTTLVLVAITSRILRPIQALTAATTGLARPSDYTPLEVVTNDEVGTLTTSFNSTISALVEFQDNLEGKVRERTQALNARNRDMEVVFQNVDQGFVTLDREGVMAMERSAVFDEWFGKYEQPRKFAEHLRATNEEFASYFDFSWRQLAGGLVPADMALFQMPDTIQIGDRQFSLTYSLLSDESCEDPEESWTGVLLVIADVTSELNAQRLEAEQKEFSTAVRALVDDREGFLAFYNELDRLVVTIRDPDEAFSLSVYKRIVHTIKGNAAIYKFASIVDLCHEIEDEVEETEAIDLDRNRALTERWRRLDDSLQFLIDAEEQSDIRVGLAQFEGFLARLLAVDRELYDELFTWRLESMASVLTRLAARSEAVAEKVGVEGLATRVDAEELLVDAEVWNPLWNELAHVIRNALDHGLVGITGRTPELVLAAKSEAEQFVVEVADNGRGIDWEKVRAKAASAGLPHAGHDDLVAALFSDGLSTRDAATENSGRGVGMAAVQECVLEIGGRTEVDSTSGSGTVFRFIFPDRGRYERIYASTLRRLSPGVSDALPQKKAS